MVTEVSVGGDDDAGAISAGCCEGLVLLPGREVPEQGEQSHLSAPAFPPQRRDRLPNFMSTREEDQRVRASGLGSKVGAQFPGDVIPELLLVPLLWRTIPDLHRMGPPLRGEARGPVEVGCDRSAVERGGHDEEAQVGPVLLLELPGSREGDVPEEMAFVKLVEDDRGDRFQRRVREQAAEQNPFRHVENPGGVGGPVLEADLVSHLFAEGVPSFLGDPSRQQPGRGSSWLEDDDGCAGRHETPVQQDLGNLGGFAGTGGGFEDEARASGLCFEGRDQFLLDFEDGQLETVHRRRNGAGRQGPHETSPRKGTLCKCCGARVE